MISYETCRRGPFDLREPRVDIGVGGVHFARARLLRDEVERNKLIDHPTVGFVALLRRHGTTRARMTRP